MKKLLAILLSFISVGLYAQSGSINPTAIRSRVADSTLVQYPTGWGVLYYNAQSNKWRLCDGAAACQDIGSISSINWGMIEGDIADQTDLQDSLSDKRALKTKLRTFTTNHTLVLADAEKEIFMNSGSPLNITVPPNSSVALPLYTTIWVTQTGAGQLTFVEGAGVNINPSSGSLLAPAQGAFMQLYQSAIDTWELRNGVAILPIDLTSDVTGILPVPNGGTGLSSVSAGRIPYGNGTSALQTSTNLTFNGTAFVVNPSGTITATGGDDIVIHETGDGKILQLTNDDGGVITLNDSFTGQGTGLSLTSTTSALQIISAADVVINPTTHMSIGGNASASSEFRMYEQTTSGSNYTAHKVAAQAADITYTWPATQGAASTVLTNNGSGGLSWVPAGGGGSGSVTSIATTSPITGGTITTTGTIGINNAAADGATLGAATFTAADFNATSGVVSLDYTNAQKATGSVPGFLSSADWTTFNGKQSAITFGTGVQTALGVNIGSAGAPVLFNGAGGTPSSITLTNATGTASGLTAGNVTTNANLTGDVTSVGNATTLATVNSNVGSFGSATLAPILTVNGKGLVTAVSTATITPAVGSITGLGTGIATFLATPSSANLASAVTNETGSGSLVFGTSPSLTTPDLGIPSAIDLTNATNFPNTVWKVGGNTLSGSAVLGSTSAQDITMTVGNANYKLSVNGTQVLNVDNARGMLFADGGGTIAGTTAFDFRSRTGDTRVIRFANQANSMLWTLGSTNGEMFLGNNSSTYIGPATRGSVSATGPGIAYRATQAGGHYFLIGASNMGTYSQIDEGTTAGSMLAVSSTTGQWHRIRPAFDNTTSATAVAYTLLELSPTFNLTGGGTTIRVLDFNPTETSLTGGTRYGFTWGGTGWLNGINNRTPTASLHIGAGTTTIAPLKLTSGTNLTTPADGAMEFDATHLYFTIGSTRYQIDQQYITPVINSTVTSVNNVGAGEDDLYSYTIPAALFSTDKDAINATFSGRLGASGNNKRIRVRFGNTIIFDTGAIPDAAGSDWNAKVEVYRVDATNQKAVVTWTSSNAALLTSVDYTTATETMSGTVSFRVTGEGTNTSEIVLDTGSTKFFKSE